MSNCVCGKLTVGGTDHCFIHDPDEGRWMSKATFGAVHEMTEACTTNCRPVWVKHPTINASAPGAESGRENG